MESAAMRRLAIGGALLLVAALTASAARERARPGPRHVLIVGGVEDAAKWGDPSGNMALARRAGFRVIVLSSIWRRPLWAPGAVELDSLRGAIDAADAAGIRPIVAVYSFSSETPLSARDRAQFASYAAAIAREIPELRYISLGNEPNSDLFWMPQFGPDGSDAAAAAYFKLLELGYRTVKRADPRVTVIGGSLAARGSDSPRRGRPGHSPSRFIADLGKAFRASGLAKPPLDLFSIHPYPANSSIPPTVPRPPLDRDRDRRLPEARAAADGGVSAPPRRSSTASTASRPRSRAPSSRSTPACGPPRSGRSASSARPTTTSRRSRLAACQPLVRMLIFFHVTDESQLTGLQTGLFYPDDKPKASLGRVAASAEAAETGQVRCS